MLEPVFEIGVVVLDAPPLSFWVDDGVHLDPRSPSPDDALVPGVDVQQDDARCNALLVVDHDVVEVWFGGIDPCLAEHGRRGVFGFHDVAACVHGAGTDVNLHLAFHDGVELLLVGAYLLRTCEQADDEQNPQDAFESECHVELLT